MSFQSMERKDGRPLPKRRPATAVAMFVALAISGSALAQGPMRDTVVRAAAAQEQVQFVLTLPLRNTQELSELIEHQYTVGHPEYHHFLRSAEFDQRFG